MQGIFDTSLLLFHLRLGSGTDAQNGNTAGQLGQALLQLLAIVVAGRGFDLLLDLTGACLDLIGITSTIYNGRIVFVHDNALGLTEVVERGILELVAFLLGDDRTAREDGNVFEHGLATIAESRCLDGSNFQRAAQLVDNQRGQSFAFHIFRNDDKRATGLSNFLQNRKEILHGRDLLVEDQQVRIIHDRFHAIRVGHEVGGKVAAIELHAFHHVQRGFHAFGFLDRDDTFFANTLEGVSNVVTDGSVVVGRNRSDLGDLVPVLDFLADAAQMGYNGLDGFVDAALEVHRVGAGSNVLQTGGHDGLG